MAVSNDFGNRVAVVDQTTFVYAAMAATAIAWLYSVWIGFSRFEVTIQVVFWASCLAIKLLAWWSWDGPLELLEAVLPAMQISLWVACACSFILAGTAVARSCKHTGAPVPFLGRCVAELGN